jgi:hypothetical protein
MGALSFYRLQRGDHSGHGNGHGHSHGHSSGNSHAHNNGHGLMICVRKTLR